MKKLRKEKLKANSKKNLNIKRFTQIIALLFAAISLQAQKIDTRLTSLLPSANMPMSIGGASASEEDFDRLLDNFILNNKK